MNQNKTTKTTPAPKAEPFHVDDKSLAHAAFWLGFAVGSLSAFVLSAFAMG
jgi:hypothetical protein